MADDDTTGQHRHDGVVDPATRTQSTHSSAGAPVATTNDIHHDTTPNGPQPETPHLTRNEIDALYDLLEDVMLALDKLQIECVAVGGSLLGAVRSESILFNDDEIALAIVLPDDTLPSSAGTKLTGHDGNEHETKNDGADANTTAANDNDNDDDGAAPSKATKDLVIGDSYESLKARLPSLLTAAATIRHQANRNDTDMDGTAATTTTTTTDSITCEWRTWEGCDWIKSSRAPDVKLSLFVLRKYQSWEELTAVAQQSGADLLTLSSLPTSSYPLYHYDNGTAIAMYPDEYFTHTELFPIKRLPFGHLRIRCPRDSIGTLRRFFGDDCFSTYFTDTGGKGMELGERRWQGSAMSATTTTATKRALSEDQYRPVQHSTKRVWTDHTRKTLQQALAEYDEEQRQAKVRGTTTRLIQDDQEEEEQQQPPLQQPDQQRSQMTRTRSLFAMKSMSGAEKREQSYHDLSSAANMSEHLPSAGHETEPAKTTKYFGRDVRAFTEGSSEQPVFDHSLRAVMEPHIVKARKRREEFRNPLEMEVEDSLANAVGVPYTSLRDERRFLFDEHTYPIHRVLAETLGVEDLSKIHLHPVQDKRALMSPLLDRESRRAFHECYDNFVTAFCIPLLHSLAIPKNIFHTTNPNASSKIVYRYQAFPCIRIIRPDEFSIGPHCDIAYGHSVGNLNFHIPLTPALGTNALYTESHPGREDWHPLTTKSVGLGYLFDGARCIHFALENTTDFTRVSLDFRVAIYRKGNTSGPFDGGLCNRPILEDRFWKEGSGYYDEALIDLGVGSLPFPGGTVAKKTNNRLLDPDRRAGFPFTAAVHK